MPVALGAVRTRLMTDERLLAGVVAARIDLVPEVSGLVKHLGVPARKRGLRSQRAPYRLGMQHLSVGRPEQQPGAGAQARQKRAQAARGIRDAVRRKRDVVGEDRQHCRPPPQRPAASAAV